MSETNMTELSSEEKDELLNAGTGDLSDPTNDAGALGKVYDIEDAPDDFNLDSLLAGMDEKRGKGSGGGKVKTVDLGATLKSDQPHFKVELNKLALGLRVAAEISAGAVGKNLFAKAVGFKANASTGTLRIYSCDFLYYFSYDIPLIGMDTDDKISEKFFAVSYPIINKLVKACEGFVLIYEKEGKFYLKLEEGDIEIETMAANEELIVCKEKPIKTYDSIDTEVLKSALSTLYPYACLAVNVNQRRVYIIDNTFYAQYMFSCARLACAQSIPNMDLSVKEMKILYTVMNGTKDTQIKVSSNGKRIFFEGESFIFTTMIVGEKMSQELIDGIDKLIFKPEHQPALVATSSISKIVDLSDFLSYSIHRLQFNFGDSNNLLATMLTKRSNSEFCIGSVNTGVAVTPLEAPIEVQSALLRGMVTLFKNNDTVDFYTTPHGVGMRQSVTVGSNNLTFESVLYTESVIQELNKKPGA